MGKGKKEWKKDLNPTTNTNLGFNATTSNKKKSNIMMLFMDIKQGTCREQRVEKWPETPDDVANQTGFSCWTETEWDNFVFVYFSWRWWKRKWEEEGEPDAEENIGFLLPYSNCQNRLGHPKSQKYTILRTRIVSVSLNFFSQKNYISLNIFNWMFPILLKSNFILLM